MIAVSATPGGVIVAPSPCGACDRDPFGATGASRWKVAGPVHGTVGA